MNIFISHSAKAQIGPLRDLLSREGVSSRDSFDVSAGKEISEKLIQEIHAADAVIAVISDQSPNVFYEVGIAAGLQKPVLGLLNPGTSVPSYLSPINHLTSDLSDSDILRLGVKRFLAEAKGGTADVHPPEKTQPRPHDRHSFEELASQISRMRQSGDAAKIHQTIADILRKAEPTVEEHTGGKDPGADFAVWSDDLRGSLGNPILVELKASKLNEMSFRVAYSRLARKVQDSGSAAGLLLYLEKNGKRFGRPTTWIPSVLWFDAEDFARELSEKSFAQVLVERRNRTVHGLND